jgi:hypothetical protein
MKKEMIGLLNSISFAIIMKCLIKKGKKEGEGCPKTSNQKQNEPLLIKNPFLGVQKVKAL